jgi:hypothetical protein
MNGSEKGWPSCHALCARWLVSTLLLIHEVCPVVELAHNALHAILEHGDLECPALQLVHKHDAQE